jgi:hypothetical protein
MGENYGSEWHFLRQPRHARLSSGEAMMAKHPTRQESLQSFIAGIKASLEERRARGDTPPLVRRKLRTIAAQCGYDNVLASFLGRLKNELQKNGLYTEPPVDQQDLAHDDSVYFSTGPFPPDSLFFPKERQLQEFVKSCLGSGRFRGLQLYQDGERNGWEFPVPGGRVDLLCEEKRRRGKGALVAMELKRGESAREAVVQLAGYIDKLRHLFPGRAVKGIVISGREDVVGLSVLREFEDHGIEWYCYRVEFNPVSQC